MSFFAVPGRPANLRLAEPMFVGVGVVVLLVGCVLRSYQLPMWLDELFSFNLIQDPSLGHMLRALGDQADGSSPLYYLLIRPWAALFSLHEMSLRLFSAVAFCAAFALLWLTLRRAFDFWPTALSLALIFGTNETIRFESGDIRAYGLLFALLGWAVFLAVELGARERPGWRLLAGNGLVQAALVLCHPLGGLYSACLLVATVAGDAWTYRRPRWAPALSYPVGWLALLLWWEQMLRQADITFPRGWIAAPAWADLSSVNSSAMGNFSSLGVFLAAWCVVRALSAKPAETEGMPEAMAPKAGMDAGTGRRRQRLLFVGSALIGMLPLLWVFSYLVPNHSMFLARYLLGVSIGWSIILTQLCTTVLAAPVATGVPGKVLPLACAAFILLSFSSFLLEDDNDRVAQSGYADVSYGYTDLPIVCQRSSEFLPRAHYSPRAARYYFLLDWDAAMSPANHYAGSVADYKLLRSVERYYGEIYHNHIMDAAEFLRSHSTFLIQNVPQTSWITARLNPEEYVLTPLTPTGRLVGMAHRSYPLVLVEKRK